MRTVVGVARALGVAALAGCAREPACDLEAHCEALLERGEYLEVVMCAAGEPPIPDLGAAFYALGNLDGAACVYAQLLTDDPLTVHNLAAVRHYAGHDAEPLFEFVLARALPGDGTIPRTLLGLADYYDERGDWEHAERIRAQAEDLFIIEQEF
jgi:tetratricopeptide (TPR) repeat protein